MLPDASFTKHPRVLQVQQAMVDAETERDRARTDVAGAHRELREQADEIARRSNVIDELEEALHAARTTRARAPSEAAGTTVDSLAEDIAHLEQVGGFAAQNMSRLGRILLCMQRAVSRFVGLSTCNVQHVM